jgi:arylsulfatase A
LSKTRASSAASPAKKVVVASTGAKGVTNGVREQRVVDRIMETLTAKATGWLEANHTAPFFLYFAPNAVHGPIAPHPRFTGSPYGGYGDFIHELDWSVGQILAALDRLKLAENTLVIFTSDNGGIVDPGNGNTGQAMEAGLAVNGHLRGGKHTEYEGGFRVPFVVRWPGRVPANTVSDQLVALPDVLATLAAVLKVALPKGAAEDSGNVLRALTEPTPGAPVRDHVIMQAADGTYALRRGDWKLIERVGAPKFERRPTAKTAKKTHAGPPHDELFNLKEDPSETRDLSAAHADQVASMKRFLAAARDRGFTRTDAGK